MLKYVPFSLCFFMIRVFPVFPLGNNDKNLCVSVLSCFDHFTIKYMNPLGSTLHSVDLNYLG